MWKWGNRAKPEDEKEVQVNQNGNGTGKQEKCSHFVPTINRTCGQSLLEKQENGSYVCSQCGRRFSEEEKSWMDIENEMKKMAIEFASAL